MTIDQRETEIARISDALGATESRAKALADRVAELAKMWSTELQARREAVVKIDQLTAALEAAERGWEQDVKAAAEAIQKKTKCVELAELSATAQRCAKEQAERRAEVLQARVAELKAENATLRVNNRVLEADNADHLDRRRTPESELANMRGRVERALKELQSPPQYNAKTRCAEVLRGH